MEAITVPPCSAVASRARRLRGNSQSLDRDNRAGGGDGDSGAFSSNRPTSIGAGRSATAAISVASRMPQSMPPGSKQCEGLNLGEL